MNPSADTNGDILLSARDVVKIYRSGASSWFGSADQAGSVRAVDGVSLDIRRGETVGLVGESGCGKTTFGKAILRLLDDVRGEVCFDGAQVYDLEAKALRALRRRMQMVFQNPYAALNNHMRVRHLIAEGVRISGRVGERVMPRVLELLEQVNLNPEKLSQFPWELSGGERRRVGLARILAVDPEFIVADEPVAALDLSIKSQIINLLTDLKEERNLTYLIISHDIGVIKYVSDRVAVMYMGRIVEVGDNRMIRKERCLHPYTEQLLTAAAFMSNNWENSHTLHADGGAGWEVPDEIVRGCRFHPRCQLYQALGRPDVCTAVDPELLVHDTVAGNPHAAACHHVGERAGETS